MIKFRKVSIYRANHNDSVNYFDSLGLTSGDAVVEAAKNSATEAISEMIVLELAPVIHTLAKPLVEALGNGIRNGDPIQCAHGPGHYSWKQGEADVLEDQDLATFQESWTAELSLELFGYTDLVVELASVAINATGAIKYDLAIEVWYTCCCPFHEWSGYLRRIKYDVKVTADAQIEITDFEAFDINIPFTDQNYQDSISKTISGEVLFETPCG